MNLNLHYMHQTFMVNKNGIDTQFMITGIYYKNGTVDSFDITNSLSQKTVKMDYEKVIRIAKNLVPKLNQKKYYICRDNT